VFVREDSATAGDACHPLPMPKAWCFSLAVPRMLKEAPDAARPPEGGLWASAYRFSRNKNIHQEKRYPDKGKTKIIETLLKRYAHIVPMKWIYTEQYCCSKNHSICCKSYPWQSETGKRRNPQECWQVDHEP